MGQAGPPASGSSLTRWASALATRELSLACSRLTSTIPLLPTSVPQRAPKTSMTMYGRPKMRSVGRMAGITSSLAANNGQLGFLDFNGQFTSSAIGGTGGDGGADFVLGLDDSFGRGVSTGKTWQQSSNVFGIYAQDTWRFTERLTLNP